MGTIKTGRFTEVKRSSHDQSYPTRRPLNKVPLQYDDYFGDGYFNDNGGYAGGAHRSNSFYEAYDNPGDIAQKGMAMGLPFEIDGNPSLGCGCGSAKLHGMSEVVNGQIECDYMCDYGWHNFVVLSVLTDDVAPEREIKYDKFGNVITTNELTELQEY